ncbi:MAG TPA: hypothetical protein VHM70_21890 [Polyangiaceae bacterium]|jgi:hypothetical protein|nr:hypothetical protein [Polyangiaceae bacterium]
MLAYDCDWKLGFNLDPLRKGTIGYLTFWSGCSGLSLSKDVEVWNPMDGARLSFASGSTIQCIGLIEHFDFAGEEDSPIRISAYVSRESAANIRAKLAKPVSATSVQVAWYIVSFDEDRKQWFEAAFVKDDKKAQANVDTASGVLQLSVDPEAKRIDETLDIKVFRVEFQIIPTPGSSNLLEFATGATQRLVLNWAGE